MHVHTSSAVHHPMATDECPDGRLGASEAVLVAEPCMDPPGGVVLLVVDRLVGGQPAITIGPTASMTGAGRRLVRRYDQGPLSSRARRIVVRLW
jgi:hypothetical protein